jgi:hypothetical protein
MIAALARAFDGLFGRGEAAVTVPPLDGALRPNRRLDEADQRVALDGVDDLATAGGTLVASAGDASFALANGVWGRRRAYPATVAALAAMPDGLAVALASGEIVFEGGRLDGRRCQLPPEIRCVTAMTASGGALYVANGSATNAAAEWQRDLLERNATGSVWRVDPDTGRSQAVAMGLAWPAGLAVDDDRVVWSEAWRHSLVALGAAGRRETLLVDLPGYPGRIAPAADGWWLAAFAPRSQLVEFVLREPAYRKRMMTEVPQEFWVAPRLRSGRNFYESLQGGGVKHLGMLKPWAPTQSAGLCIRLDRGFQPRGSLQSRADGRTHGVTAIAEHDGRLFVAARGDGVVVSLPATDAGDAA